jgi:large subunit ribosomal protein L10
MNREQKSVAIAEIAGHIDESEAIFAVDYRGISVAQVAELRAKLRDADATFKVVKNSLTERAADQAGAESLKDFLAGPTALTFVRGDAATAAKAVADYGRAIQMLPFKGGLMGGSALDVEQIRALSRLPSREVLYGQLVGVVASPVSGLVRSLGGLLGGLAVALGQVRDKKESGEIPAGDAPAAPEAAAPAEADGAPEAEAAAEAPDAEAAPAEATDGEAAPEAAAPAEADGAPEAEAALAEAPEAEAAPEQEAEAAPAEAPEAEGAPEPEAEAASDGESSPAAESEPAPEAESATDTEADAATGAATAEGDAAQATEATDEPEHQTEPAAEAATEENQADVSAEKQSEDAETSPKED